MALVLRVCRSRAVEYEIDEKKLVAKRKWEYRHDPDRYGLAMGGFDVGIWLA